MSKNITNKLKKDSLVMGATVGISAYIFAGQSIFASLIGFAIMSGAFYLINKNKQKYR